MSLLLALAALTLTGLGWARLLRPTGPIPTARWRNLAALIGLVAITVTSVALTILYFRALSYPWPRYHVKPIFEWAPKIFWVSFAALVCSVFGKSSWRWLAFSAALCLIGSLLVFFMEM